MRRSLDEFIFSIECIAKFPFVRLMPLHCVALSSRLILAGFIGSSGRPKRFLLKKHRGREDRLHMSDTINSIWFPAPEESFRKILTRETPLIRQRMGRYTWLWSSDGMTLLACDDMEFHFTGEEALALDKAIFVDGIGSKY